MVDVAVVLPESQPGDDEDVIWGLSTAAALWARGERGDAVIWLRRAAEAAAEAGQEARAGELLASVAQLEHAAAQHQSAVMPAPPPPPPSRATAETLPQVLLEPEDAAPFELDLESATPPPAPPRQPTIAPPPARVAPAPPPPSTARTPTITPPPPSTSRTPSIAPPALSTSRTPSIAPPALSTSRTPSIAPPAPPPPRGPLPSYTAYASTRPKAAARAPILDPWADEPTLPSLRLDPAVRAVLLEGDEVMVQLRRNQPRIVEDDDGVVTSAATIDTTLRRAQPRPPTPPTRKWTASGEQPPGYIAEIGAVPSKAPARPRPPSPSSPAPDTGKSSPPSPSSPAPNTSKSSPPSPSSPAPNTSKSSPPLPSSPAPVSSVPRAPSLPPGALPAARPPPSAPPAAVSHFDALNASTMPSTPSALKTSSTPSAFNVPPVSSTLPALDAPTMPATPSALHVPTTPSALDAPTMPATPSTIPRSRPMTVPPSASAARVPAPSRASSQSSPSILVATPVSVRPPPSSTSVRPPPSSTSVRPPSSTSVRPPSSTSVRPPIPRAPTPALLAVPAAPRPASIVAPALRPELVLDDVEAFADLSAEMRQQLVALARVEALSADEEVSAFGAALVIAGAASVCATIVDAPAAHALPGTLIATRGTLAESVALRVVAGSGGARVAVWEASAIEEALRSCPWVLEGLVARADELQAYAGATMGPLGELDDATRSQLLTRLSVRVAPPREVILDAGASVPGLILVCVGAVELPEGVVIRAGEVLFSHAALDGAPAPSTARASASGAVFLVADRALSAELAASPSLITLFAR